MGELAVGLTDEQLAGIEARLNWWKHLPVSADLEALLGEVKRLRSNPVWGVGDNDPAHYENFARRWNFLGDAPYLVFKPGVPFKPWRIWFSRWMYEGATCREAVEEATADLEARFGSPKDPLRMSDDDPNHFIRFVERWGLNGNDWSLVGRIGSSSGRWCVQLAYTHLDFLGDTIREAVERAEAHLNRCYVAPKER